MDLLMYVDVFSNFMQNYQPVLDSTIKFGTSAYTIGSSLVKVLQNGKHLATVAVGKKNAAKRSKAKERAATQHKKAPDQIVRKKNAAVVVEISRPAVQDAASFLEKKKIDANLVVITAAKDGSQSLDGLDENKPKMWFEVVQEFNDAITVVKKEMGAVHMHIFLATPVALAFGLGAVWGTVDEATIYHWNGKEYKQVLEIKREIRFRNRKGKASKKKS